MPHEDEDGFRTRFEFLFPAPLRPGPRYQLCAPDLVDLRWSVFDLQERVTVAYGDAPEKAVDKAIEFTRPKPKEAAK